MRLRPKPRCARPPCSTTLTPSHMFPPGYLRARSVAIHATPGSDGLSGRPGATGAAPTAMTSTWSASTSPAGDASAPDRPSPNVGGTRWRLTTRAEPRTPGIEEIDIPRHVGVQCGGRGRGVAQPPPLGRWRVGREIRRHVGPRPARTRIERPRKRSELFELLDRQQRRRGVAATRPDRRPRHRHDVRDSGREPDEQRGGNQRFEEHETVGR